MKLNFRLDLNTIVLLLLIVVFSAILYYNFKRDRIVEGNTDTFDSRKTEYTFQNQTLSLYEANHPSYIAAWSEYTIQKGILNKLQGEYNSLAGTVTANNSADIVRLFPNTNDVKYKVAEQTGLLDIIIGRLNTMHSSIFTDITDFDAISSTSTQAIFDANNSKITKKMSDIRGYIKILKDTILDGLKFNISSIVAGDGNATITIGSATDATATSYSIKATDASGLTIDGIPIVTSPYVFNGLTNDVPYTFSVTADYGALSDGTPLISNTTSTEFTPRIKPSFTLTMGTGGATVSIATTPGTPMYTISVTSSTGTTTTSTVTTNANTSISGLENGILYTFEVIADYGNGTLLKSDKKTGTPRAEPMLSIKGGDSLAMLTITAPNTTDKPTSYTISATPAGVIEKTESNISLPIPFTGLVNGKTYKFSVVAVYSDGTKSSPATIDVTPNIRPTATSVTAIAGNSSAIITIVPPTTGLPTTILDYSITYTSKSTITTIKVTDRRTTISGLTNGTSYTFGVVVNYKDGTSSLPKESSPVTPTLPAPNITVTATAGSKKATINISRTSPTTTRAISKYEITYTPPEPPVAPITVIPGVPLKSTKDVTVLNKGTKYKFTVKAFYSDGTIGPSAISNEITVK